MATFNIVFDESGKGADSRFVVWAGGFATSERWNEFSRRWAAILRQNDVQYFRATEAFTFSGAWKKFGGNNREKERRRDDAIRSLSKLATMAQELNATIINSESFRELPKEKRDAYLHDPFYAAFEQGTLNAIQHSRVAPEDTFNLICDDSEEYSGECLRSYRRFAKAHPDIDRRISGICFVDDKKYVPLQLADMFAYCLRRELVDAPVGLWKEIHDYLWSLRDGDAWASEIKFWPVAFPYDADVSISVGRRFP